MRYIQRVHISVHAAALQSCVQRVGQHGGSVRRTQSAAHLVQLLRHGVLHEVVPPHFNRSIGFARGYRLLLQAPQAVLAMLLLLNATVVLSTVRLDADGRHLVDGRQLLKTS
jgi:hypothetical protein